MSRDFSKLYSSMSELTAITIATESQEKDGQVISQPNLREENFPLLLTKLPFPTKTCIIRSIEGKIHLYKQRYTLQSNEWYSPCTNSISYYYCSDHRLEESPSPNPELSSSSLHSQLASSFFPRPASLKSHSHHSPPDSESTNWQYLPRGRIKLLKDEGFGESGRSDV